MRLNISAWKRQLVLVFAISLLSYGKNKVQLKDISKTEIKKVEQEYKIWHRAKMLFNLTQIADNVDFNLFSDEDAACIDLLGKAIVDAKPIVQDHDLDTITTATFGKYTLLLGNPPPHKLTEFILGQHCLTPTLFCR